MPKILVIDTETTGLTPLNISYKNYTFDDNKYRKMEMKKLQSKNINTAKRAWEHWITRWPHLIQLSYIFFDTDSNRVLRIYNKYLELTGDMKDALLADPATLPMIKNVIHASTQESETLDSLSNVMTEFMQDFDEADIIVGHNVMFERHMLVASLMRTGKPAEPVLKSKKFVCTQELATPICKMELAYTSKKNVYKFPKLREMYAYMFGHEPPEHVLHNSLNDVLLTLRCYYWIFSRGEDICKKNMEIRNMMAVLLPEETGSYVRPFSPTSYAKLRNKMRKTRKSGKSGKSGKSIKKSRKSRKVKNS